MATGSVLASTAGYAYAGAEAQGGTAGSPGVASGNSVQVPVEVPINACGNTVDVIGVLNPSYGNHCANVSGHRGADSSGTSNSGNGSSDNGSSSDNGGTTRGSSASGTSASGGAANSPGAVSGNSVQAPVHVPVNACGNSVDVVGVGNPAFGNACGNVAQPAPSPKPTDDCPEGHGPTTPPPAPPQTGGETTPGGGRTSGPSTGTTQNGGTPAASTPAAAPVSNGGAPSNQAVPADARTSSPATAPGTQLASTGAGDVEMLGAAGLALLLGGGVLYRRARAGAR
ncbi:chaplin [Kitasatospora aureofaciens]|uniref:chaplin n=1 Tax=Kitasatospora aureofaciens TaxID=1894 RepID=UPI0027E13BF2|nr:chaplin [Kitasatospora aureofaciens]